MITLPIGPIFRAIRRHKGPVGLMICEVAAGLAVSVHTYLLGAWYLQIASAPSGLDAPNLLVVTSEFEAPMPDAPASIAAQVENDVGALRRVPGVQAAAGTNEIPLNRTYPRLVTSESTPERGGLSWVLGVNAGAIEALGLRVIEGRAFAPGDVQTAPAARAEDPEPMVISGPLADQLFPGRSAVGERIRVRRRHRSGVVVGVVAPFRVVHANAVDPRAALFIAEPPPADRALRYVVRTEPGAAAAALIPAALDQGGAARVTEVRGLADGEALGALSNRYAHGIAMFMVGMIFFVVLLGRIGMSSFLVAEQTKAIGIRRALGAGRRDIIAHLLLENAIYTTLGLIAGLPLLFVIAHLGRRAQSDAAIVIDFKVVAAAWLVFWVTGLVGALAPALRAARIEPTAATRAP